MIKFNINPRRIKARDCVIRAIAFATNQSWEQVYKDLVELGIKMRRMPNEKQVYEKYLARLGWVKHKQPLSIKYDSGYPIKKEKYTVNELLQKIEVENRCSSVGKIIISMSRHLTCAEPQPNWKYEIVDTWDCGYSTVGNYWVMER